MSAGNLAAKRQLPIVSLFIGGLVWCFCVLVIGVVLVHMGGLVWSLRV